MDNELFDDVLGSVQDMTKHIMSEPFQSVHPTKDWEREQETRYVLQSSDLMRQIADSSVTHINQQGYRLNTGDLGECTKVRTVP